MCRVSNLWPSDPDLLCFATYLPCRIWPFSCLLDTFVSTVAQHLRFSDVIGRFVKGMKFDVRFTFSRFPLRNMNRALDVVAKKPANWKNFLFPDPPSSAGAPKPTANLNLRVNRLMEENPEQKLAVSYYKMKILEAFVSWNGRQSSEN